MVLVYIFNIICIYTIENIIFVLKYIISRLFPVKPITSHRGGSFAKYEIFNPGDRGCLNGLQSKPLKV